MRFFQHVLYLLLRIFILLHSYTKTNITLTIQMDKGYNNVIFYSKSQSKSNVSGDERRDKPTK